MTRRTIVDFTAPDAVRGWGPIDDVVMGGVSASRIVFERDRTVFTGEVSLAYGGGFASVRSAPREFAFGEADGVELELAGDGRRYKLSARLDAAFDGVAYQVEFVAPRERVRVRLAFSAFVAMRRGRPVPDAEHFDPARITTIGLLIGSGQSGAFRLELFELAAYRD